MASSRRDFLKGFGLVSAGLILMPEDPIRRLWALGAPLRLWGDGIHDDAPALQAIFDGKGASVIGYVQPPWHPGPFIRSGRFLIRDHITVGRVDHSWLTDSILIGDPERDVAVHFTSPRSGFGVVGSHNLFTALNNEGSSAK